MATSTEDLLVKISIDTKAAASDTQKLTKQVEELGKSLDEAKKGTKQTSDAVNSFGASAVKLDSILSVAAKGFTLLAKGAEASVGAFQDSQANLAHLSDTLAIVGEKDVPGTIKRFSEFADAMQLATTAEDDQIVKLLDMAKVMGLSSDKAEQLVAASVDLAAVTRKDVTSSFDALADSLKGNARGLASVDPQLKNLSEEAAKSGKAIEILGDRFKGAGAAAAQTFAGSLLQAKNIVGNAMEDIGQIISVGFNLDAGAKSVKDFAQKAADFIKSIKVPVTVVVRNTVELFQFAADMVSAAWSGMVAGITGFLGELLGEVSDVTQAIAGFFGKAVNTKAIDEMSASFGRMSKESIEEVNKKLTIQGLALTTEAEVLAEINQLAKDNIKPHVAAGAAIQKITDHTKELQKLEEQRKKTLEDLSKALSGIAEKLAASGEVTEAQKVRLEYSKQVTELTKVKTQLEKLGILGSHRADVEKGFADIYKAQARDIQALANKAAVEQADNLAKLKAETAAVGLTQISAIAAAGKARDAELAKEQAKLAKDGPLYKAAIETIERQRVELRSKSEKEIAVLVKTATDGQKKALVDLSFEQAAIGASNLRRIDLEAAKKLKALLDERKELQKNAAQNAVPLRLLDEQQKKLVEITKVEKERQRIVDLRAVTSQVLDLQKQQAGVEEDVVAALEIQKRMQLDALGLEREKLAGNEEALAQLGRAEQLTRKLLDAQITAAKEQTLPGLTDLFATAFGNATKSFGALLKAPSLAAAGAFGQAFLDVAQRGLQVVGKIFSALVFAPAKALFDGLKSGDFSPFSMKDLKPFKDGLTQVFAGGAKNIAMGIAGVLAGIGGIFAKILGNAGAVMNNVLSGAPLEALSGMVDAVRTIPDNFSKILANFGEIIDKFLASFGDNVAKLVQQLPEFVKKFVSAFPQIIKSIVDALPQIVKAIADALPDLITTILDGVAKLIESLPAILEPLFAKLPEIVSSIFDALPRIITAIFDAVPKIIAQILKALPGIVMGIVKALPGIVLALVDGIIGAMGEIVGAFVDFLIGGGLEKIIGGILRAIPKIVVALVEGLVSGLKRFFKGLAGGGSLKFPKVEATKALEELPKKMSNAIQGAAKKLTGATSNLFGLSDLISGGKGKAGEKKGAPNGADKLIEAGKKAAEAIGAAGKSFYDKYLQPFIDGLLAAWRWIWDHIFNPIITALREVWLWIYNKIIKPYNEALKAVWMFVYENILKPAWAALKSVWDAVYENIIKPAWAALKAVWDAVVNSLEATWGVLKAVWDTVIASLQATWNFLKAVWDTVLALLEPLFKMLKTIWDAVLSALGALWGTLKSIWDSVISQLTAAWSALSAAWTTIKTTIIDPIIKAFSTVFDTVKKNIFDPIVTALSTAFNFVKTKVFDPIVDGVSHAFDGIANFFTNAFEGLKGLFDFDFGAFGQHIADAVSGVGDKIAGPIKDFVNKFIDIINKAKTEKLEAKLPKALGGGSFTLLPAIDFFPGTIPNLAEGGVIQGARAAVAGNSVLNDKILALLSNGEGVIDRERMSNPLVRELYKAIMSDKLKGFAAGGMVGGPVLSGGQQAAAASIAGGGGAGGGNTTVSFGDVIIQGAGNVDENFLRRRFMPIVKDELRKASQNGEGIIYDSGIRKR